MNIPPHYTPRADLLAGRVVLVTGASRGLGRATALAFAKHGATVVLHGRNESALGNVYDAIENAGGPTPAAVVADLDSSDARQYEALAVTIAKEFERLDGILHSAALMEKLQTVNSIDFATWERQLRVNCVAPLALTRALFPMLDRAPDASVIYTTESHVGQCAAYWSVVTAPRAALMEAMQVQAQELAGNSKVRVNGITPGPVATPARAFTHPGESPATLPDPAVLMPAYLYLMGPDSIGLNGEIVNANPTPTH